MFTFVIGFVVYLIADEKWPAEMAMLRRFCWWVIGLGAAGFGIIALSR